MSVIRGQENCPPSWHLVRRRLLDDAKPEDMGGASQCERLYIEITRELEKAHKQRLRLKRQDEQDADTARKKRRLVEAEENLLRLLSERIKAPYAISWEEA